jgi:general secretion pathway protein G
MHDPKTRTGFSLITGKLRMFLAGDIRHPEDRRDEVASAEACQPSRSQFGFTLTELVVVVMILGILAAVAAPRLLDSSKYAADNATRQTLAVVRNAIERYAAEHGGQLPGADGQQETFKADLARYLRGEFPMCRVDAARYNEVRMIRSDDPFPPGDGDTVGTHSWVYNYETGDFYVNSRDLSADGVTRYDQF